MKTTFWLDSVDDIQIYVEKWFIPDKQPKAIVQIAHGMVEHFQRYHDFAQYLVDQGFFVYGNDHRGHGKTGQKQGIMGYFSENNGFDKATGDLFLVTRNIQEEYPNTPIILLGHSMGSFLARNYIQEYSNQIQGVILSGTGFYPAHTTALGKSVATILKPREKSPLMNKLAFGAFNRKIDSPKTPFDWLTRDDEIVTEYMQDRYAGYIPTARFFVDLMTGLQYIHNPKRNARIRKDLPILFISGEEDPVGSYAKGIWKTATLYKQLGMQDITTSLFEGARHEVLNEINKKEVYEVVTRWIARILS